MSDSAMRTSYIVPADNAAQRSRFVNPAELSALRVERARIKAALESRDVGLRYLSPADWRGLSSRLVQIDYLLDKYNADEAVRQRASSAGRETPGNDVTNKEEFLFPKQLEEPHGVPVETNPTSGARLAEGITFAVLGSFLGLSSVAISSQANVAATLAIIGMAVAFGIVGWLLITKAGPRDVSGLEAPERFARIQTSNAKPESDRQILASERER